MRLISLLVITAALASARWFNPLSKQFIVYRPFIAGEPECIVNGAIAPRDDSRRVNFCGQRRNGDTGGKEALHALQYTPV